MADIYIDPSVVGPGTGTLSDPFASWASVSWVAGNSYLQKRGTTFIGTVNVSTGGASDTVRVYLGAYGTGPAPRVDANGAQFAIFVTGSQSYVTVDGFEAFNCNNANAIGIYKATGVGVGVIFVNCYVHQIYGTNAVGMKMFCDRGRMLYSIVRDVTADGLFFEGDDFEVGWCDVDQIDLADSLGDCLQIADTTISSNNPWVHHCTMRHQLTGAKQTIVIQTSASSGGVVEDCYLYGANASTHKTLLILQPGVIARRNYVTGGVWGIALQGIGSSANDNVVVQTYSSGIGILVDQANCSAIGNTVLYEGVSASTVPGISHFNAAYTGCTISNNISNGFAYGIRRDVTACNESYNDAVGTTANFVNAGLSPIAAGTRSQSVNPQVRANFMPMAEAILAAGYDYGGTDYYGQTRGNPPTIGAVQFGGSNTLQYHLGETGMAIERPRPRGPREYAQSR